MAGSTSALSPSPLIHLVPEGFPCLTLMMQS